MKIKVLHLLFLSLCLTPFLSVQSRTKKNRIPTLSDKKIKALTGPLNKEEVRIIKHELSSRIKNKSLKSMSYDELEMIIDLAVKIEAYGDALLYMRHAFNATKNSDKRQNLKLSEADILFEQKQYKKSIKSYQEFRTLYPGARTEIEYAHYKQTVSTFLTTRKADQDQTPTKDTLKLVDAYLAKGSLYSRYTNDVKDIQTHCFDLLFKNEKGIFEFYLKKKSFASANTRLTFMKQEFGTKLPSIKPMLLESESRLALAEGDQVRYSKVIAQLNKQFPAFRTAYVTSKKSKKKNPQYVTMF